jgi:hypothetical protein
MLVFDKQEIRNSLTIENVYDLLMEWGAEPTYCPTGIIAKTICHHDVNEEASHKLYFYENSTLFRCYSNCGFFDIFTLCKKVMSIRHHRDFDLNEAVRWIAHRFGISGHEEDRPSDSDLEDWDILANYSRIQDIQVSAPVVTLEEYDDTILTRFNYDVKIKPWLDEGISQQVLDHAEIGYYPGGAQITIPHFDKDGRFIGLRGRSLAEDDAQAFGKYRPIRIGKQLYNHPLGLNIYNFNNSRCVIPKAKSAIIFEGEKSVLKFQTMFGFDNDTSVACCGSNVTSYQIQLLIDAGAREIVIAFDRQFQNYGDDEYLRLIQKLSKIKTKYKNYVNISFIVDKNKLTGYKDAPVDCGKDIFLQLYKERVL